MYTDNIKSMKNEMKKAIDYYRETIGKIRAGRANPNVLDDIRFSYYGTMSPIKNAATISVPEARMLLIQPWDKNALKEIEKAILSSDLGITPMNDGSVLRLPFPELTGERRKELTKEIKAMSEDSKIVIRNLRRDTNDIIKKMEKNSEITEDDKKDAEKEIQDITDEFIKEIEELTEKKNKEILEI